MGSLENGMTILLLAAMKFNNGDVAYKIFFDFLPQAKTVC